VPVAIIALPEEYPQYLENSMSIKPVYTANAIATGGREGKSKTDDGAIDVTMATPKEMGGSGNGNNPEQLFAVGYAACYVGAMKYATTQDKTLKSVPDDASVESSVGIGPREDGGFGLVVTLKVHMPGLDTAEAQRIADAGHKICPYSHATKGNIQVTTTVV
jgi:Ohr subfamily peroxiredoxin